jgi:hypothetical protein
MGRQVTMLVLEGLAKAYGGVRISATFQDPLV